MVHDFGLPQTIWQHMVSYGETDAMGHAYYAEFLHWFEQARSQLVRELGMSYALIEKKGIFLPVAEASCRYRRPVTFDQEIAVHAAVTHWGKASCTFSYQVRNRSADDVLAATGSTKHACVDRSGRPTPIPDWLRSLFDRPA